MSLTMSLEIESGISLNEIREVLSVAGAKTCINGEDVTGNFDFSNAYFVFYECRGLEDVVAEGVFADWLVGVRGAIHCPVGSLAESSNDIKFFLTILSEKKSCRFVLSFQYESVHAVRDEGGLSFLKEMMS